MSENSAIMEDLLAEWRLSILVETEKVKILFDCGRSFSAVYNASKLGINLNDIDLIVLSHSHHDHTGGLQEVLYRIDRKRINIIAHSHIMLDHYVLSKGGEEKFMGIPFRFQQLENLGADFNFTTKSLKIASNILTSGEIL
jgi:7,8-dihydropterin-6-yl-methyl-4-(beta-D-ribofuranosyl)aminobenzene 5'-phosphate synthase